MQFFNLVKDTTGLLHLNNMYHIICSVRDLILYFVLLRCLSIIVFASFEIILISSNRIIISCKTMLHAIICMIVSVLFLILVDKSYNRSSSN